ncbi:MAG TPA: FAD-dependent monooxygenase [Saprospiraceae bacterium]|nr:FAD-dependent monooxygenase [Saprospiraceae bacterium]
MDNKDILISGAGIAGVTLAYWLKKFGFNPTIVERAPKLREGGYAIDFWGAGYDVAERMDILPDLNRADLQIPEVTVVNEKGKRKCGINYPKLKKLMNGRAFTLLRSDLSKIIYQHLEKDVEVIFGDSITTIDQQPTHVKVTFRSGMIREFHLVIGADGLHSIVRELVFGHESKFEKFFGYYTSSYTIADSMVDQNAFLMYNTPRKQAAIYSTDESKTTTTFFIFSSPQKMNYSHHDVEAQKQILRNEFESAGWICPELLAKLETTPDFYFDVVSQVQMSRWSKERVTLVGDACDCPSLLSGQGSTLAMTGAYVLAGELKEANGDYKTAFERYETKFKPFIEDKQKTAQRFSKSFVPKSKLGIWIRDLGIKMMSFEFVSKMFVKPFMDDELKLKLY